MRKPTVSSVRPAAVLGLVAALAACRGKDEPPRLGDTGWFGTETTDLENCEAEVLTTVPEAGDDGWYWRDRPEIFVATASDTYVAWLQDAAGDRLDTELRWDETGLAGTLEWDGWLEASTDYELVIKDCKGTKRIPFRTSGFGAPLEIAPSALNGRTYLVDLVGASWEQPPILGSLISGFFTAPVLLGVIRADVARIDLMGAPGYIDSFGVIQQDTDSPIWDFPIADFSEAPYLDAGSPRIELVYNDTCEARIPVKEFVFQGTFSADGEAIGGAVLSGMGDSRYLGCLLGQADDPAAVCGLAADIGVQCEPCDDGEPYCLYIEARDIEAVLLPDLQLKLPDAE